MAVVVTIDSTDGRSVEGARFVRKGTITLGTYATNGVAITATSFELPGTIADLDIRPAAGFVPEWDKTNAKVKLFIDKTPAAASALAEVGNAVDVSATAFRFYVKGY